MSRCVGQAINLIEVPFCVPCLEAGVFSIKRLQNENGDIFW